MLKTTVEGHRRDGTASVEFTGTKREINALKNALTNGMNWIRVNKRGTIIKVPALKVPKVQNDDEISPFFNHITQYFSDTSIRRLAHDRKNSDNPSYFVQHITGYGGEYNRRKDRMEAVGFECLRSRRGDDGKYWEIWYLPGAWAATGELKGKSHDDVMTYLRGVCPGQITVSGEKWGLSID